MSLKQIHLHFTNKALLYLRISKDALLVYSYTEIFAEFPIVGIITILNNKMY